MSPTGATAGTGGAGTVAGVSRAQRRLLAGVGILSLIAAVLIVVAANRQPTPGGRGDVLSADERPGGGDGDGSVPAVGAESTLALAPVRGGTSLPTTTAAPSTTAAREAPVTTTTSPPPALEAKGSPFGPPPDTSPRASVGGDCATLASPGWTVSSCGTAATSGGPVTWLVEAKGKGWRALLLKAAGVGQWAPYLAAGDDSGGRWSEVKARMAEGPGGSNDQLVGFGFRARTGGALGVDLVRQGQVAAHVEMAKGAARLSRAQLDTWGAQADGTYLHQVIRWSDDAWRVVATESVSAALVPPSHL